MTWNWQQDAWPEFSWDRKMLMRAEALFAEGAGVVIGASKHLSIEERNSLTIELMSHEAVDTSAIEGEPLDRDSVQSSIRRHLGFQTDHRRASPAEAGIVWGTDDIYFPVEWSRWLAKTIPGTTARIEIDKARIFFPEERPGELNALLRNHWIDAEAGAQATNS